MYITNAKITGISCEACVKLVKRRLKKIKDAIRANVELNGKIELHLERIISKNEIKKIFKGTGYDLI